MTIENAQKDIIDNFLFFDDWTQKYEYIIELSKDLEFMSENLKSEDNLIKGCHACHFQQPRLIYIRKKQNL